MKPIGNTIRNLRLQKGYTQEVMAFELGISLPAYSKIERNITDVSISRLLQISKVFNLTLTDLLMEGDSSSKHDCQKCKQLLEERDQEIIRLQKKIIELMEDKNY